ncbi:pseudouridine synthase [Chytridium lagenaria]|nr:pseudouridine synthase [Chytridium lagenaria]
MSTPGVHTAASGSTTQRVAVLFGYNGASFNGLEREAAPSKEILNAIATLTGQSILHPKLRSLIFRGPLPPEEGEHAARQVLSLEIKSMKQLAILTFSLLPLLSFFEQHIVGDGVQIPTPDALNAILPESIRVFKIANPTEGFSARRTCDARTYEYLIPTYVFSTPPPQTGYAHNYRPDMSRDELDALYPESEGPTAWTYSSQRSEVYQRPHLWQPPEPLPSPPDSPGMDSKTGSGSLPPPPPSSNPFSRFFETITRGRRNSKTEKDNMKPSVSNVEIDKAGRSRSAPAQPRRAASTSKLNDSSNGGFYGNAGWDNGASSSSSEDDTPKYYDPIDIPIPTEEQLSIKRRFRIAPEQVDMLRHLVAIFRGTHNFHNYIPGAKYDDERCYMRILSMELSEPEVHFGMEWIRIKVQAKAFARFQIRRMLAMMVLVVRTNTPRSIVANSFGFAQVDLPEAPAIGLICDEPFYLDYNNNPNLSERAKVSFTTEKSEVERFQQEYMYFDAWLRSVDRFAFLYHFFLNSRGLVNPRRAFLKPTSQAYGQAPVA